MYNVMRIPTIRCAFLWDRYSLPAILIAVLRADDLADLAASCLRGALPPVDL